MRLFDRVSPYLEDAVAKLNDIAGYEALTMDMISGSYFTNTTVSPEFIFTRFVRDAIVICQQISSTSMISLTLLIMNSIMNMWRIHLISVTLYWQL